MHRPDDELYCKTIELDVLSQNNKELRTTLSNTKAAAIRISFGNPHSRNFRSIKRECAVNLLASNHSRHTLFLRYSM